MPDIEYREYRPEDAEGYLRIHDAAFPAMPADAWREVTQGPVTAAIATMDGEVVGAVPFHMRDFVVRPGVTVRAAVEFSVCVREDLRDRGVGSGMMRAAKQFLRGRAQAMMVHRGDERSSGYRYYARNGHHDLLYARPWGLRGRTEVDAGAVEALSWAGFLADEAAYLEAFHSAYAGHGGFTQRTSGFYGPAVRTAQYHEVPLDLRVLVRRSAAGIDGYAILGEERLSPQVHLLEIAARGGDQRTALALLAAFANGAAEGDLPATALLPDSAPHVPLLRALGFRPAPRGASAMMIMFHAIDPEGMAAAAWHGSEATAGLEVIAWTPEREVTLQRSRTGNGRRVLLEMKEEALTRLVSCRLDLAAAVAEERVTALGATPADIAAIAAALPYTPWACQYLDFV